MDNKKWYKRVATCFWFFFATLPLWVTLIQYVMQYVGVPDNLSSVPSFNSFTSIASNTESAFSDYIPGFIKSIFYQLCDLIDTDNQYTMYIFMAWFTWSYFLHLMVDFIVWLPKFFHSILEKGVGKIDD